MTMITPSYLGETIEYSSLHACRSTLEDPTEIAGEEVPKGNFSPRFMGSMFGHAGIGGAVAFGDADKEIGFSFLCNEMHPPKDLYKTANLLIDSLYSKI